MARETPWEDEYTLLCERCGYVIEGLDTSLRCPECGKPIEESLPERRVGTPWQRDPSFMSLLIVFWSIFTSPRAMLDLLAFMPKRDVWFFRAVTLAAAFPPSLMLALILRVSIQPLVGNLAHHPFTLLLYVAVALVPVYGLLVILTEIERRGLELISRTRGWRMSRAISGAITAHGSIGWLIGVWLSTACIVVLGTLEPHSPTIWDLIFRVGAVLSFFCGLVIFEAFAYLGLRRLKYANRVRPQGESTEPGTASS